MYIFTYTNTGTGYRTDKDMNTLFSTMNTLRDELMLEYGNDSVFLREVQYSDTLMTIRTTIDGVTQPMVGSVECVDGKWVLSEFNHDEFKRLLELKETLKGLGILN